MFSPFTRETTDARSFDLYSERGKDVNYYLLPIEEF
jgi:hypothetical protein